MNGWELKTKIMFVTVEIKIDTETFQVKIRCQGIFGRKISIRVFCMLITAQYPSGEVIFLINFHLATQTSRFGKRMIFNLYKAR